MDRHQKELEIFDRGMKRHMKCTWRYADGRIKIERMDFNTWQTIDSVEFSPGRRITSYTDYIGGTERTYTGEDAFNRAAAAYEKIA